MRFEIDSRRRANRAKPDEQRQLCRARIVAVVGPEPLARDKVFDPVAVDIDKGQTMHLRQLKTCGIACRRLRENRVAEKQPVVAFASLFKPGQPPAVGVLNGDDILVTITVEVVGKHLCPAGLCELRVVKREHVSGFHWLLPPTVGFEDIGAAIAIDVADTQAMGEATITTLGCHSGEAPRCRGGFRVGRGVPDHTFAHADQLSTSVAGEVAKPGRFPVDGRPGDMPLPMLVTACRIGET